MCEREDVFVYVSIRFLRSNNGQIMITSRCMLSYALLYHIMTCSRGIIVMEIPVLGHFLHKGNFPIHVIDELFSHWMTVRWPVITVKFEY